MEVAPPWDPIWLAYMVASYRRFMGRALGDERPQSELATWLYEQAPFCLLSHDGGLDPRFVYANLSAQRCFEYGWDELVGLPSRLSALPDAREERDALLTAVTRAGYATGYRGLRVAKSGRRFWIEDVTVWNVLDENGRRIGQAATYQHTTPALPGDVAPLPGR